MEIAPGVEGMIHISELADGPIAKADEAVKEGDMVEFVVLATDADERRFSLSRRAAIKGLDGEELKQYIGAASGSKTAFAEAFNRANSSNS